jgi:hypothetical protein
MPIVQTDRDIRTELVRRIRSGAIPATDFGALQGQFPEADRLIASNPATSPEVLATLSHSNDKATRRRLAQNPGTPLTDLLRLGSQFPAQFLANPALDLILLENPGALTEFPRSLLIRLLKARQCPEDFLSWAARSPDEETQLAVSTNPGVTRRSLAVLQESPHPRVRDAAWAALNLAERDVADPESYFRNAVSARLKSLPYATAFRAWDRRDIGLAQWAHLPAELRLEVAVGWSRWSRLLWEGQLHPCWLEIVTHESASVWLREAVATNARASSEVLAVLATDREDSVRLAVAQNPGQSNAEPAIGNPVSRPIEELAEAQLADLLIYGALTPTEIQHISELLIRREPLASPWFKAQLVKAPSHIRSAVERQDFLAFSGPDPNRSVLSRRPVAALMSLSSGPFVEPGRIARVVGSSDWLVRAAAARNRGTPDNLITRLSEDPHPLVRALAAQNLARRTQPVAPNHNDVIEARPSARTIEAIKARLLERPCYKFLVDPAFSEFLVVNDIDALSPQLLCKVFNSGHSGPLTRARILRRFATFKVENQLEVLRYGSTAEFAELYSSKKNVRVLSFVARKTRSSKDFERLATHPDLWVRAALLWNPHTPNSILERLLADPQINESFRAEIAKKLERDGSVLANLACDANLYIRKAVAGNFRAPPELLWSLAQDAEDAVREAVASNPGTPADLLADLAARCNPTPEIMLAIAANPNATEGLLEQLVAEVESNQRYVDAVQGIQAAVARNRAITPSLLERFVSASDSVIRANAAVSPNASAAVLELLGQDEDFAVRQVAARNPHAPPSVVDGVLKREADLALACLKTDQVFANEFIIESLRFTAATSDQAVTAGIRFKPIDPDEAVDDFYLENVRQPISSRPYGHKFGGRTKKKYSLLGSMYSPELARRLCSHIESAVSRGLAGSSVAIAHVGNDEARAIVEEGFALLGYLPPDADNQAITKASRSMDWLVRYCAACHPNAPETVLEFLRADHDPDVVTAATYALSHAFRAGPNPGA